MEIIEENSNKIFIKKNNSLIMEIIENKTPQLEITKLGINYEKFYLKNLFLKFINKNILIKIKIFNEIEIYELLELIIFGYNKLENEKMILEDKGDSFLFNSILLTK